jgi:hypothetical protein
VRVRVVRAGAPSMVLSAAAAVARRFRGEREAMARW